MVRALNIVLLKLASEAPSGPVICSLVHVLLRCTGATDVVPASSTSYGSAGGGLALVSLPVSEPLPPSSTKPASRLLLRVLAEESRRPEPFVFAGWRPPWPSHLIVYYPRYHLMSFNNTAPLFLRRQHRQGPGPGCDCGWF